MEGVCGSAGCVNVVEPHVVEPGLVAPADAHSRVEFLLGDLCLPLVVGDGFVSRSRPPQEPVQPGLELRVADGGKVAGASGPFSVARVAHVPFSSFARLGWSLAGMA